MPCHILRVFACKMNCGAVEEMKKTKIYNDNKLKLKDISGDHRFILARRLFNIIGLKLSLTFDIIRNLFYMYGVASLEGQLHASGISKLASGRHLLLQVNVNSECCCQPILVGFKITEIGSNEVFAAVLLRPTHIA